MVYTGMIWSAFRASGERVQYGYNIPSNMYASIVLGYLTEILRTIYEEPVLASVSESLQKDITEGLEKAGKTNIPSFGKIYAFETDGNSAVNNLLKPLFTDQ